MIHRIGFYMPGLIAGLFVSVLACAEPRMTFVYMTNYAPFSFENEQGEVTGIQPEVVENLAKRLGIKVRHELHPWNRSQQLVRQGKVDAMLTTPTAARHEYAVFAREETTPNLWNLFVRKGNTAIIEQLPGLNGLDDLKRFRLLDFLGNGWTKLFMKPSDGFNQIHFLPDPSRLPLMLARGRGDLVITSSEVMNYHANEQGVIDKIEEFDIDWQFTRFHQVIQVSRQSPWLDQGIIKGLDRATREMKVDGDYMAILNKYHSRVGRGYPFKSQLDEAYVQDNGFYENYDTYPEFRRPGEFDDW